MRAHWLNTSRQHTNVRNKFLSPIFNRWPISSSSSSSFISSCWLLNIIIFIASFITQAKRATRELQNPKCNSFFFVYRSFLPSKLKAYTNFANAYSNKIRDFVMQCQGKIAIFHYLFVVRCCCCSRFVVRCSLLFASDTKLPNATDKAHLASDYVPLILLLRSFWMGHQRHNTQHILPMKAFV